MAPILGTLVVALVGLVSVQLDRPPGDEDWRPKVEPRVLESARATVTTEILILLSEQSDLSGAALQTSKPAKGRWVFEALRRTADRTQPALIRELERRSIDHRSFWIVNMIWARADYETVRALARRPDVARLFDNTQAALRLPLPGITARSMVSPAAVEASLAHVGAPDLWSQGYTGRGVVVAGADTGYDWDHPALINQYRGWNGSTADHDYNWHDAIHSYGSSCGADSPEPCDDNGHGTHTMGIMVGDDGNNNQIGMAPGARWIGCRNMEQGIGSVASYSECFQFFLAPTDLNGQNPDPDLAPHVVNNSWSCPPPPIEDCDDPEILKAVVQNLRAAGILVVASAGNGGSACATIADPPAIYESAFSVGAAQLDALDSIASFSSRGPVTVDGSDRLKPDVVAPGVGIRSSLPGGSYGSNSGTSMAAPHVAGLAALILSALPCWSGNVDAVESHIRSSAVARTTIQTCGGVPGSNIPNNTYGYGAIRAVLPDLAACLLLFRDGFDGGDTSEWSTSLGN